MENTPTKTTETRIVEFVPHGTNDKIKLSIEMVKRLIAVKTRSGKTCTDEDAFKFMVLCQARRLNPFEGDAFLIGYDGQQGPTFSLITSHQAFLKRAELHPEFDGMDSGVIVLREGEMLDLTGDFHLPNDQILGGWATVYFKGRTHPMRKRLRVVRFNKGFGVWKEDPAGMICKCAEADALRSSFPTMLGGFYIEQEMKVLGEREIAKPIFEKDDPDKGDFKVVSEPVVSPSPEPEAPPAPEPAPTQPPPPGKKKAPPEAPSDEKPPPVRKLKPKAKTAAPKETPNHTKLAGMLALGNFVPTDMIAVALDNGWIEVSEAQWEKLSEDKCAEFMDPQNWEVIMDLLEKRAAARASAPEKLAL